MLPVGQPLRNHLGQAARSASPDGSFAIARIANAKDPATSNDRFVAATLARSTREAATCVAKGALTSPIRPHPARQRIQMRPFERLINFPHVVALRFRGQRALRFPQKHQRPPRALAQVGTVNSALDSHQARLDPRHGDSATMGTACASRLGGVTRNSA